MERALVLAPFSPEHLEGLRRRLKVRYESWLDTRRLHDPEQLAYRLREDGITVLVVESDFVLEETLRGAPGLKFVGICRTSTSHVDVDVATELGVAVVNTPGRNARAVAEHALGLILALARRIPTAHQYVKEGRWQHPMEPYLSMRGVELGSRTLGIVGLGSIGRRLAEIGLALDMKIRAYDPYVQVAPQGMVMWDLDRLMAESDFVCVHLPLTTETEGLLNAARLGLMKPTSYLVNASDASVLDLAALVQTLHERRIAGAAFDVFESHPPSPNSPLMKLDNVVFSPHLGGATEETIWRHSQMMVVDVLRYLDGRRPERLVNPEVWKRSV